MLSRQAVNADEEVIAATETCELKKRLQKLELMMGTEALVNVILSKSRR